MGPSLLISFPQFAPESIARGHRTREGLNAYEDILPSLSELLRAVVNPDSSPLQDVLVVGASVDVLEPPSAHILGGRGLLADDLKLVLW